VDLATHQRALLELIASGSLPASAADDPYLREVAGSAGLRVVREIVAQWEAYDVRRSCPLTAAALARTGRFDELMRTVPFGSSSAFVEARSALFLEEVARREGGLIGSIARFEQALLAVRNGEPGPHVIEWDRNPAPVVDGLLEGQWLAEEAARGRYRTVVAADLSGLVSIERLDAETPLAQPV
jgi:hypothetical protein